MSQFHDNEYWNGELRRLLRDQVPEDSHREYKDKMALLPHGRGGGGIDSQKRAEDVSKDVSSFLNSDGGVLIYGVPETNDPTSTGGSPAPLSEPEGIGFPREGGRTETVSKETIERLITDNIQPIPDANLFKITEIDFEDRIVFVVEVAAGIGNVWQARDKRYYHRSNYENRPMEHNHIEMVRSRSVSSDLKLVFGLSDRWEKELRDIRQEEVTIYIGIQNDSNKVAESAYIELGMPNLSVEGHGRDVTWPFIIAGTRRVQIEGHYSGAFGLYECHWPIHTENMGIGYRPIFKTNLPLRVAQLVVNGPFTDPTLRGHTQGWLLWQIQAPDMEVKKGMTALVFYFASDSLRLMDTNESFEIL